MPLIACGGRVVGSRDGAQKQGVFPAGPRGETHASNGRTVWPAPACGKQGSEAQWVYADSHAPPLPTIDNRKLRCIQRRAMLQIKARKRRRGTPLAPDESSIGTHPACREHPTRNGGIVRRRPMNCSKTESHSISRFHFPSANCKAVPLCIDVRNGWQIILRIQRRAVESRRPKTRSTPAV